MFPAKPAVTNIVNMISMKEVLAGLWQQVLFIAFPKKSWTIKMLCKPQETVGIVRDLLIQKCRQLLKQAMCVTSTAFPLIFVFLISVLDLCYS